MKFQITITLEYNPDLVLYPEGNTPEQNLAIDLENARYDLATFLAVGVETPKIKGKIIP